MTLDDQLLVAHLNADHAALVDLYEQAANEAANIDAACFYLTHAYVFALEMRHPKHKDLRERLAAEGRI